MKSTIARPAGSPEDEIRCATRQISYGIRALLAGRVPAGDETATADAIARGVAAVVLDGAGLEAEIVAIVRARVNIAVNDTKTELDDLDYAGTTIRNQVLERVKVYTRAELLARQVVTLLGFRMFGGGTW